MHCGRDIDGRCGSIWKLRVLCGGDVHGQGGGGGGLWHGQVQHFGHVGHLAVVEVISVPLEHRLGRVAADVVVKDKLARERRTLLSKAMAVGRYEEGLGICWISKNVDILLVWGGGGDSNVLLT